ncbi:MAG: hypothetical protein IT292_07185 [Deltaproteobacteria bacterium]|nr:hypothetical protein [Deltaproteobacteria bacterium]
MDMKKYKEEHPEFYRTQIHDITPLRPKDPATQAPIPEEARQKFANIQIDEDTKIYSRNLVTVANWQALLERWSWEGISGSSLIFATNDIKHLSDDQIIELVVSSGFCLNPKGPEKTPEEQALIKSYIEQGYLKEKKYSITLTRHEDYIFANFDFITS